MAPVHWPGAPDLSNMGTEQALLTSTTLTNSGPQSSSHLHPVWEWDTHHHHSPSITLQIITGEGGLWGGAGPSETLPRAPTPKSTLPWGQGCDPSKIWGENSEERSEKISNI